MALFDRIDIDAERPFEVQRDFLPTICRRPKMPIVASKRPIR